MIRIISMLLVCAYHWEIHGYNNGIVTAELSVNQFISFLFGSWGVLGVNLFFLLSFYFLTKKKHVNDRRVIGLVIKTSFYGTSVVLTASFLGIIKIDYVQILKSVGGVFTYQYWFISVYLIIVIFSNTLNAFLAQLTSKEMLKILGVFFYLTYLVSWSIGEELVGRLSCALTLYITIYFLENKTKNNFFRKYRYVGIFLIAFTLIIELALSYLGMNYNPIFYKIIKAIQSTKSPVMYFISLFIFYVFLDLNIKNNKIINFISLYSSGAYMLHGGASFIRDYLWDDLFKAGEYFMKSPAEYLVHYLICINGLFFLGIVCELIYSTIIEKIVDKIYYVIKCVILKSLKSI